MTAAAAEGAAARAAAIAWMVELRSGDAGPREQQAFAAWLADSPAHREAWQRLAGALESTFAVPAVARSRSGHAVDAVLTRAEGYSRQRRRALRGALAIAGVGVASTWLGRGSGLLPDLLADLHTATAERREYALPGGSTLLLDARSSANANIHDGQQRVALRAGQVIASLRSPATLLRIDSAQVQATLRAGRCLLRCAPARTLVAALAGTVTVAPRDAAIAPSHLRAGEAAWFGADGMQRVDPADVPLLAAWERGMLAVRDRPLGEVVARLQAYRKGLMRIDAGAAALRVSGSYPLDDSDAALQALAETLPIAVRRYTGGWLVRIERSA